MSFLLATTFADPYSSSFFMTDYEEGLYFSIANFAFHRNHFGDPPNSQASCFRPKPQGSLDIHIQLFRYIRFSRQIVKLNYDICL